MLKSIAIIIPAFQPNEELIKLIKELRTSFTNPIIVVDDGSDLSCSSVFNQIESSVYLLHHPINKGKGCALKTAMEYALSTLKVDACITVDADGQHRVEDIQKVIDKLQANPECLILGAREFNQKDVPLKSYLGNTITRFVTRIIVGQKIQDTQTGLRAFNSDHMRIFMTVPGERYEFEMNMLLYCKKFGISIKEEMIKTIYLDKNSQSHFNPWLDSVRIYKQIAAFGLVSILSLLIDIIGFTVLLRGFHFSIVMATIIARLISMNFNFLMNRTMVFKSKKTWFIQAIQYYTLGMIQMFSSAYLVKWISVIPLSVLIIKLGVDFGLFTLSYQIQKLFIFTKEPHEK